MFIEFIEYRGAFIKGVPGFLVGALGLDPIKKIDERNNKNRVYEKRNECGKKV
jgi:hypothetical protein